MSLRFLSPAFITECLDASETDFGKVLSKLFNSKTITPTVADKAKPEYHKFITRKVKERERV